MGAKFGAFLRIQEVPSVFAPKVNAELLDTCVFVYPSKETAERCEAKGGSGFIIRVPSRHEGYSFFYVVTNKHVVTGQRPAFRVNTSKGLFQVIETEHDDWVRSIEDDLAVCPLPVQDTEIANWQWHHFSTSDLITEAQVEEWHVCPGSDVVMAGRLKGYDGRVTNKPIVRFGNISMMPDPTFPIKFKWGEQVAFLVECRSTSGMSGSSVMLTHDLIRSEGIKPIFSPQALLGIDAGHVTIWDDVYQPDHQEKTGLQVRSHTSIAVVIPAWRLQLLMNEESLVEKRNEADANLTRRKEQDEIIGVSDSADSDNHEEPFTKAEFESALRKVSQKLSDEEKSET